MPDAPIATSSTERTVSNWAAPAVKDLFTDALTTYNAPYEAYSGAQVATAQPLQTQAFTGLQGLATPTNVTNAANFLNTAAGGSTPAYLGGTFANQYTAPTNVYSGATVDSMFTTPGAYQPTTLTPGFTAPGAYQGSGITSTFNAPDAYQAANIASTFNAPDAYQAANIASTFNAPTPYQAGTFSSGIAPGSIPGYQGAQFSNQFKYAPTNISTGLGEVGSVQSYFNPYVQDVVDVQAREARRQAEISRIADAGRLAKAGAYGGSRQTMMEAEGSRNLATQLGDITAKGYQTAYDTALKQRLAESGLSMDAQKATEQARQFGAEGIAKYGLESQKAQEQSRQFAYDKGVLTPKEMEAKYGLEAQRLTEQSKQFGAGQALTAAELQSRFALDAAKASEQSKQFGAGQALTAADLQSRYALDAAKASELSRQFGAGQAKDDSDQQITSAHGQGNLGIAEGAQALQRLEAQSAGGATQRAIEQQKLTADYKDFIEQRDYEANKQAGLAALLKQFPMETTNVYGQAPDPLTSILGGGIAGYAALKNMFGSSMSVEGLKDLWKNLTGTDVPTEPAATTTN